MTRGGFSIVEIVITVTILAILLTLGVVSMGASQVSARDAERKADVEALAMYLEDYYKYTVRGNGNEDRNYSGDTYPDVVIMGSNDYIKRVFPDMDQKILRTPGVNVNSPQSLVWKGASSNAPAAISEYAYEPLNASGGDCTDFIVFGPCVKFNLYYRLEKDNSVQVVTSRNQ